MSDKIDNILEYVHRTNPEMTEDKLKNLIEHDYGWITLAIISENFNYNFTAK